MKLLVVIPVHAPWHVAELTIGSFLKQHPDDEIDLHVGVHLNFCDYTKDFKMFEDLRGFAQIHMVEEIDWGSHRNTFFRYSTMHAKNLANLLHHAAYYTFDRLVILDHDLLIKAPFVKECVSRFPDADLIGAPFQDTEGILEFKTDNGHILYALPKTSVWHTILTRKAFDKIMEDPRVIYPKMLDDAERPEYFKIYGGTKDLPVFIDTFADVLHRVRHQWGLKHGVIPTAQFAEWIQHFSGSSFNYGFVLLGKDRYHARMEESLKLFSTEFPDGLRAFLEKKKGMRRQRHVDSRDKGSHNRAKLDAPL